MILQQTPTADPSFDPPHVVLLTHEFRPFRGGVATYCDELARSLHRLGCNIRVWAPDYGRLFEEVAGGPPILRFPGPGNLRPGGLFSLALGVWKERKNLSSSILLLPSVGAQMVVMVLSLFPGWPKVRLAVLWHGSEILRFEEKGFWKLAARKFFPKVEFFFVASAYVKALAKSSSLVPPDMMLQVIPCAAGSDALLDPKPSSGDPLNRVRVLTLARLHPRKGQLHTIRALAELPPAIKGQVIYQIAGQGDSAYLEELRKGCLEAEIAFEYLGPVAPESLSSVYAQCDIYVMTSRSLPRSVEGFGITYLEAGLQSKPVIACRSGGVEGAVIDRRTGLLVDEDDLPALTAALASLISDRSLRLHLGEGNLRHALHFSWNHSAQMMLGVFMSARPESSPHKKG